MPKELRSATLAVGVDGVPICHSWQSTEVESEQERQLWIYRAFTATMLPKLTWRWSGLGLLQAYVHEWPPREHSGYGRQAGERSRELRIHIWTQRLARPGIERSGNVHNHRFRMRSTILSGVLWHTEYQITKGRGYVVWDFPNASASTAEERCKMRRTDETYSAEMHSSTLAAGTTYSFEKWAYHSSVPFTDLVITLVEKTDQEDRSASVLAPLGVDPVSVFGGDTPPMSIREVLDDAHRELSSAL